MDGYPLSVFKSKEKELSESRPPFVIIRMTEFKVARVDARVGNGFQNCTSELRRTASAHSVYSYT